MWCTMTKSFHTRQGTALFFPHQSQPDGFLQRHVLLRQDLNSAFLTLHGVPSFLVARRCIHFPPVKNGLECIFNLLNGSAKLFFLKHCEQQRRHCFKIVILVSNHCFQLTFKLFPWWIYCMDLVTRFRNPTQTVSRMHCDLCMGSQDRKIAFSDFIWVPTRLNKLLD